MHATITLPEEIIEILSNDSTLASSPDLAGCRDITYIAQNTTKQGIIFWDQPTRDRHDIRGFITDTESDNVHEYHNQTFSNTTSANEYFNSLHDYSKKILGTIHHIKAKIVTDYSTKSPKINNIVEDEVCSNITKINLNHQDVTTTYFREITRNKLFVVAATTAPHELRSLELQDPTHCYLKIIQGDRSKAAAYATLLEQKLNTEPKGYI